MSVIRKKIYDIKLYGVVQYISNVQRVTQYLIDRLFIGNSLVSEFYGSDKTNKHKTNQINKSTSRKITDCFIFNSIRNQKTETTSFAPDLEVVIHLSSTFYGYFNV